MPKCWEMAIPLMHAGDSLKIYCPSFYAYGGEKKYSQFDSDIIEPNSDLLFSLKVIECEETHKHLNYMNKKNKNNAVI
jgi:FKBP-type peptidyl-prolyl cis-trans isomerase